MANKKFLDVAKKVAKNMENASINADGASAEAISQVTDTQAKEETQPQKPVEPIINPNLVADAAQKVNPRPEGVNVGKFTIPNELVDKVNDTAAKVIEEQQKTPEQREEDQFVATQQEKQKTYAEVLADLENQKKQAEEEGAAREKEAKQNAAWAGATEMASAIANLIAVGHGASSQQYKSATQDWMRKADSEAKESRNRIQDLRARQNETKLQMAQLREKNLIDLQNYRRQKEADKAQREYQAARTAYENARTESERAAAAIKAREAAAKIENLEAQARKNLMQGQAAVQRANNARPASGISTQFGLNIKDVPTDLNLSSLMHERASGGMNSYLNTFGTRPAEDKGKEDKDKDKATKPLSESYFD